MSGSEVANVVLTADVVLITEDHFLPLVRRRKNPYKDYWALPGGKMDVRDRSIAETAEREMREETGLMVWVGAITGVYSDIDRDPRGRYISVAFLASVAGGELRAGDDAADVAWFSCSSLPALAFDHKQIIRDALAFYDAALRTAREF